VILLGWVSFFTDTASEMIYPLLPLFLTRVLGAGAMSLGVIEGAAEAASAGLKILSGWLADRWRGPKILVLSGYGLSSAVRPLIALASSWLHVFALRFADRVGKGIRGAPRDAMLAHFADSSIRGRVFGFHRAMDHAGAVVGPLLAAAFLFFFPGEFRPLFALTIVPGVVVMLVLMRVPSPRQPVPTSEPRREPLRAGHERHRTVMAALWRPLLVIFLFTLGNASDAFLLLRLSDLGVATPWIPLLWSGLHVVKVLSSVVGGDLSDRLGRRTLIALGWVVYALVYAGFAAVEQLAPLVGIFLAYGLYFGMTEGVEKAWIADLAPAHARGSAFGVYNAVIGIGSLAASLLFGLIWTRISPEAAFLTGAALALAATGLLYLLVRSPARAAHA
jgi:MFS family permease